MTGIDKGRARWLGWLVLVLSVGAFVFCIQTKGLSLIVLPAIAAITVGCATRRMLAWWFGGFYCASYLLFGFFGLTAFPLSLLGMFLLTFILDRTLGVVVLVTVVLALLLPALAAINVRRHTDSGNVRQISLGLQFYRDEDGVYPDRLSQLGKVMKSTKAFTSPPAEEPDWFAIGPLRMWFHRYDPGPVRPIRQWSEVDDGDYLYRKPSTNALPDTIVLMTRPGLLYRNGVNIGYFDGHIIFTGEQEWKSRRDVLEFLKDLNRTNLLSVSTGD